MELFFLRLWFLLSRWDFDSGPLDHTPEECNQIKKKLDEFIAPGKRVHGNGLDNTSNDKAAGDKVATLTREEMKYLATSSVLLLTNHAN